MLDADILILLRRQVPEAEAWLDGLPSRPPVCGYAALELLFGCQNTKELKETEKFLSKFRILFPSAIGVEASLTLANLKLSHGLGSIDALIAATALEHGLPLYTFNVKHFGAVPGLQVIVPYPRNQP